MLIAVSEYYVGLLRDSDWCVLHHWIPVRSGQRLSADSIPWRWFAWNYRCGQPEHRHCARETEYPNCRYCRHYVHYDWRSGLMRRIGYAYPFQSAGSDLRRCRIVNGTCHSRRCVGTYWHCYVDRCSP